MSSKNQRALEDRVITAAEAALASEHHVSLIDVFVGTGLLAPSLVDDWRKGRAPYLEQFVQGRPEKIAHAKQIFRDWAERRGLKTEETVFLARTLGPQRELQFTASGDPELEKDYRIHYFSPELSEKKKERIHEKLTKPPGIVVFWILRDSQCAECKTDLPHGSFLVMEADRPLCLTCADLDHLVFLPRGDMASTRRARKYSPLSAVVVRFSRARKHYERQGILVVEGALSRAEQECFSDADLRAQRREQEAVRRSEKDQQFTALMANRIRELFPGCLPSEAEAIAKHATRRNSGRVGRTSAGRALDETALQLAVVASIRHNHTNYDELLMRGMDRASARGQVRAEIEDVLDAWKTARQ